METAAKPRLAIPNDRNRSRRPADAEPLFVVSSDKPPAALPVSGRPPFDQSGLTALLFSLEARLRQIRLTRKPDPRVCAEEILAMLRELARFDRDVASLDVALPELLGELWAPAYMRSLVLKLLSDARLVLHPRVSASVLAQYETSVQIARFDGFLEWFSRRHAALLAYAEHPLCDAGDVLITGILHDQHFLGERGCEVFASVRVDGLEFQTLWVRAMVYCGEEPVALRDGWHFWAHDPEQFSFQREAEEIDSSGSFVSLLPVMPVDQRAIYDQVRLFVPYAALDLPLQSRQQLDFEVALLSSSGRVLASDACCETIALPGASSSRPIPSPAALGFWERNVGRDESIVIRRVCVARRLEARREIHMLEVEYDLCVVSREVEELSVEMRLLTLEGNLIESALRGFAARDGSFLFRQSFNPDSPVASVPSSLYTVPLTALELDAGVHDLLVELTVIGADNRVICGAVERLSLEMPEMKYPALIEEPEAAVEQAIDTALTITGVTINGGWRFNLRDALRVEVSLFDGGVLPAAVDMRVLVDCVEGHREGAALLMRALHIERSGDERELSRIFTFDSEEVLKLFPENRVASALEITVEIVDHRRAVILSTTRECLLGEHFGRERNAHTVSRAMHELEILDAEVRSTPQRGGECLVDLVLNFDPVRCEHGDYTLYCEPIVPGRAVTGSGGDGCMVELPPPLVSVTSPGLSMVQERRTVRLPLAASAFAAHGARLMLFSPGGRLLQVVYQRVGRPQELSAQL